MRWYLNDEPPQFDFEKYMLANQNALNLNLFSSIKIPSNFLTDIIIDNHQKGRRAMELTPIDQKSRMSIVSQGSMPLNESRAISEHECGSSIELEDSANA